MAYKLKLVQAYDQSVESVDELRLAWKSGKDFWSVETRYTSIRDINTLKDTYDHITITGHNKDKSMWFETAVFTHILAGITTYV